MRIRSILFTLTLGTLLLVPAHAALAGNPCGIPDRWSDEPSAAVTTEVEMDWCAFIPTVAHVEPGDTVTFRNLSPGMSHTVTGVGGGMLGWDQWTGESRSWIAPDEPGVYPYACLLHPGMVGAIVVGGTDAAGSVGDADAAGSAGDADAAGFVGDADAAGFVGDADGGWTGVGNVTNGTWWVVVAAVALVVVGGTAVRRVRLARTDPES